MKKENEIIKAFNEGYDKGYEHALDDLMKIADKGEYEDIRREVEILRANPLLHIKKDENI